MVRKGQDYITDYINEINIELDQGDIVVLYTDGVTEAKNIGKQQYGSERLCAIVKHNWQQLAEAIKQRIIEDVKHYVGK